MTDKTSIEKFSLMAKAFSHVHRIDILKLLINQKEVCCSSIVGHLPLAQSTVSQHLKILKEAGLIKGTTKGPSVLYSVNSESFHEFQNTFQDIFSSSQNPNP